MGLALSNGMNPGQTLAVGGGPRPGPALSDRKFLNFVNFERAITMSRGFKRLIFEMKAQEARRLLRLT